MYYCKQGQWYSILENTQPLEVTKNLKLVQLFRFRLNSLSKVFYEVMPLVPRTAKKIHEYIYCSYGNTSELDREKIIICMSLL